MLQKGIDVRDKACYSVPHAKVAQLVEHSTENAGVVGSIPSLGTNHIIEGASSPARSGLRRFCCLVFFTLTAKLTAKHKNLAVAVWFALKQEKATFFLQRVQSYCL